MKPAQSDSQATPPIRAGTRSGNKSFFPGNSSGIHPFFRPANIQPRLKTGDPEDEYEREAEKMATGVQQFEQSGDAGEHDPPYRSGLPEKESPVRLRHNNQSPPAEVPQPLTNRLDARSGYGQALPGAVGSRMNRFFGTDFSRVRVHTDGEAARLSNHLNARAFTYGQDIYFNSGQYQPASKNGRSLLAHELTHVVQQGENRHLIQKNDDDAPVQQITFGPDPAPFANAFLRALREVRPELFEEQEIRTLVYIEGDGAVLFDEQGEPGEDFFQIELTVPPGNYRVGWSTAGDILYPLDERGQTQLANSIMLHAWFWDFVDPRPDFLVIPGPGNNFGTGLGLDTTTEETTEPEPPRLPVWAREAYRGLQGRIRHLEEEPSENPETAANLPDRVVPWVNQRGAYLNVWYDQAVTSLRMDEDESTEELLQRVVRAVDRIKEERTAEMSTEVAEGAEQTGFEEVTAGPDGDGTPAPRVSAGPQLTDEELYSADSTANAPAYGSVIVNYGLPDSDSPDSAIADQQSVVAVEGASNRLSMELDYSVAGSRTIDQVAARLQHIRYYWEVIDVTGLAPEEESEQVEDTSEGRGEMIHPLSGEVMSFRRDLNAIGEDTRADIEETLQDPFLLANWPSRAAYLQLIGLSNGVRVAGSIISSYISLLTTPRNEINVGWDRPGDFVIRCVASPVYEEDAQVRRASSVATLAVRVVNIHQRAAQMVQQEETRLERLRQQLAEARSEEERAYFLRQIREAERIRSQGTMERVSEQMEQVVQQQRALEEVARFNRQGGSDTSGLSPGARLMRAQLEISGVSVDSFREQLAEQRRVLTRMQRFGARQQRGMRQAYRPRVVLVSEETGQVYQMVMMLGESTRSREGSRHYKLVDLSSPATQDLYEGYSSKPGIEGHNEAIHNAFVNFRESNEYGRGTIAIQLPDEIPEGVEVIPAMRSAPGNVERALQRLQDLAVVAEIAGLVVAGPVGIAIGLAGGAAGAIVAGARLHRRIHAERFDWDFTTFMDITAIVGGAVPLLGVTSRRMGRFVYYTGIVQLGQSALVIPVQLEQQLRAVEMNTSLSPGERAAQRAEAFLQAMRSGIVTTVSASQMMQHGPPEPHTRRPAPGDTEPAPQGERQAESAPHPERTRPQNGEQPGEPAGTDVTAEQIRASEAPETIRPRGSGDRPQLDPVARELVQHRDRISARLETLDPTSPEATLLRLELADINEAMQGLYESEHGGVSDERSAALDRNAMELLEHLRSMDDSAPEGWRAWEVDPLPDATVMQGPDPTDAGTARRMYDNTIQADPLREAAIYRNTDTGELIIVQGEETTVSVGDDQAPQGGGRPQRWKELLEPGGDRGEWDLIAHYHPLDPSSGQTVPVRNMLPSGSGGDFGVLILESARSGDAYRTSRIDYRMPDGTMGYTQFSFVPGSEHPLVVEMPEAGSDVRRRFSFPSLEAYHEWANNWSGGRVDMGVVDPALSRAVRRVRSRPETGDAETTPSSRVDVTGPESSTPETPRLRPEPASARAGRLARERSMAHFAAVRGEGAESPVYFGRHEQTFDSILRTLRNKQSELLQTGQEQLLPYLNGEVLSRTADHFILENPDLLQHLRQIVQELNRSPNGARRSEGWEYLRDNLLGGDDALLNYILTGRFRSHNPRGMGTRTVGARKPDLVVFDLTNHLVRITDWTTDVIGEHTPHNFKTRFYVEVMKSLLGPDGPSVQGQDVRIRLDPSGEALDPEATVAGPVIE